MVPDLFEVKKNQEILSELFLKVNEDYVDEIDPAELMRTGTDAMLGSLDPYTVFYSEGQITDAKLEDAPGHGVIGAELLQRENKVMIGTLQEEGAAHKAGLMPGDIIKAINGRNAAGRTREEVEAFLSGGAGMQMQMTVLRGDTEKTLELSREGTSRKSLIYHGVLDDGETGYIKLGFFGQGAAREMREAFNELKKKGIERLVIDLRYNPGGLLQESVSICNLFIPEDELIVSIKGKKSEHSRTFNTQSGAVDPDIPISVLINSKSASASEIVAGAIQDLDRGIVVGQRSLGKGLVQATKKLPYNAQVKITVAKYYTPSGRCIQALDYSHRNENGSVSRIPDSLTNAFKTRNGRTVRDGGGIQPDIEVPPGRQAAVIQALLDQHLLFDYATRYQRQHDSIPAPASFTLSDKEFDAFLAYLEEKNFSYNTETEQALENYKQIAEKEQYFADTENGFRDLKQALETARKTDLQTHSPAIRQILQEEIASRYHQESGRLKASLKHDQVLEQALQTLHNTNQYASILKKQD